MLLLTSQARYHSRIVLFLIWTSMMILSEVPKSVVAHVPPRNIYYGHRVAPREHFSRLSPSFLYNSPKPKQDSKIEPTCAQLKAIWKTNIRYLSEIILKNGLSNDIPKLVNNPYYLNLLLWKEESSEKRPHFGHFLHNQPQNSPINDHHNGNLQESYSDNSAKSVDKSRQQIPGHFIDEPVSSPEVDSVFGKIIMSPDEITPSSGRDIGGKVHGQNHHHNQGVFGKIVTSIDTEDGTDSDDVDMYDDGYIRVSGQPTKSSVSSIKQSSSSKLTADDFFNTGIWHDKPVKLIP